MGHDYDYVDADALLGQLSVRDGALVSPSGASYRALQLGGSSARMTLPVLRRIAGFAEAGSHLEAAEAASDDDHVDLVGERRPVDGRFDVRVVGVVGELSDDLYVLVVSVGAQPFVPFDAVAVPHGVGIEASLGGADGFSLSAGGTQRWGPFPRSCGAVNKRIVGGDGPQGFWPLDA